MSTYKDFGKTYIGDSDIASLTMRSVHDVCTLNFMEDSSYHAYVCYGDDVEIGDHYRKVFEGETWLKIYDDSELTYNEYRPNGFKKVTVYRAGDFGCIIHWHDGQLAESNKEEDGIFYSNVERFEEWVKDHAKSYCGNISDYLEELDESYMTNATTHYELDAFFTKSGRPEVYDFEVSEKYNTDGEWIGREYIL